MGHQRAFSVAKNRILHLEHLSVMLLPETFQPPALVNLRLDFGLEFLDPALQGRHLVAQQFEFIVVAFIDRRQTCLQRLVFLLRRMDPGVKGFARLPGGHGQLRLQLPLVGGERLLRGSHAVNPPVCAKFAPYHLTTN